MLSGGACAICCRGRKAGPEGRNHDQADGPRHRRLAGKWLDRTNATAKARQGQGDTH
jgi:hypothetical protein